MAATHLATATPELLKPARTPFGDAAQQLRMRNVFWSQHEIHARRDIAAPVHWNPGAVDECKEQSRRRGNFDLLVISHSVECLAPRQHRVIKVGGALDSGCINRLGD